MTHLVAVQTAFQVAVVLVASLTAAFGALLYQHRVRLPRPALGVMNRGDVVFLSCVVVALPVFYLHLPLAAMTTLLGVTFGGALSIGYRGVLPRHALWAGIGLLFGADLWTSRALLGSVAGWQVFWLITSTITLLGVVAVANLYVQGGMRLVHVAAFGLVLACYDGISSFVLSTNVNLGDTFLWRPFDPVVGFRVGPYSAVVGMGDLLMSALFTTAARKAYGRAGVRLALGAVVVFGAVVPCLSPLVLGPLAGLPPVAVAVPVQVYFAPPAFAVWYVLHRRYGPERRTRDLPAAPAAVVSTAPPARTAPAAATPQAATPVRPAAARQDRTGATGLELAESGTGSLPETTA